jgi:membrane associated rhomboid family serine protease
MRSAIDYGFPPFTRAVKVLLYINLAIFLVTFLAAMARSPLGGILNGLFGLNPTEVVRGQLWQLVTYSFLHAGPMHVLFNMLGLWMFGSRLEQDWGRNRFLEFYFFCVIGAALSTVGMSYTHALGMSPNSITVGASGGIYGLLVAFGMLYGRARVYVFGIFPLEARVFAAIWIALALFGVLSATGDIAHVAHLGGAIFGFVYLRFLPRRGLRYAISEGYYGTVNRYHRWRRRQAAKKFEVYMQKHDRSKYFDEYGNYRGDGPGDRPKDDGESKGGWVN